MVGDKQSSIDRKSKSDKARLEEIREEVQKELEANPEKRKKSRQNIIKFEKQAIRHELISAWVKQYGGSFLKKGMYNQMNSDSLKPEFQEFLKTLDPEIDRIFAERFPGYEESLETSEAAAFDAEKEARAEATAKTEEAEYIEKFEDDWKKLDAARKETARENAEKNQAREQYEKMQAMKTMTNEELEAEWKAKGGRDLEGERKNAQSEKDKADYEKMQKMKTMTDEELKAEWKARGGRDIEETVATGAAASTVSFDKDPNEVEWKDQVGFSGAGTFTQEEADARAEAIRAKARETAEKNEGKKEDPTKDPAAPEVPKREKLFVVSADEIARRYAWSLAEEKLRKYLHEPEENMNSGNSRMRSIMNNIWGVIRHPVRAVQKAWVRQAETGYLYKFYREALDEITNNQNLMQELEDSYRLGRTLRSTDPNKRRDLNYEILDNVIREFSRNVAEREEQGVGIIDFNVQNEFQNLIADHHLNGWTREEFERRQRALINDMKSRGILTDADFLGGEGLRSAPGTASGRNVSETVEGRLYASNLYKIAEDYRVHIESKIKELSADRKLTPDQEKLVRDHVRSMIKLDINLGAKFRDIHNRRPEGTLKRLERFIEWGQTTRMPILRRIASNPGSGAILGAFLGNLGGRKLAALAAGGAATATGLITGAWIPIVAAGVGAGVWGYMRRSRDMKRDRGMHQRQRTLGMEFGNFRRGKMEKFQYDTKSTDELWDSLHDIIQTGDYSRLNYNQKKTLADMFARYKVELARTKQFTIEGKPNRTVDLISALGPEEGKQYGTNYLSKTELKTRLYNYLRQNNLITAEGSEPVRGTEFRGLFNNEFIRLVNNIDDLDRQFDSHRKRSSLAMGAIAGASGCVGAFVGQELISGAMHRMGFGDRVTAWDTLFNSGKMDGLSSSLVFPSGVPASVREHLTLGSDGKTIGLKSSLPAGWRLETDSATGTSKLIHDIPGSGVPDGGRDSVWETTKDWNDFVSKHGWDNSQRISYEGFNKSTELMMNFRDGSEKGEVLADVSGMFGKGLKDAGSEIQNAVASGKKFYLTLALDNDVSKVGSQFNPILIEIDKNGMAKIPKELAGYFFKFDSLGKVVNGPGFGLKTIVLDTGARKDGDGAMIVRSFSAIMGEQPQMKIAGDVSTKTGFSGFVGGGRIEEFLLGINKGKEFSTPFAAGPAVASRWQLEEQKNEEEKEEKNVRKRIWKKDMSLGNNSDILASSNVADNGTSINEKVFLIDSNVGENAWEKYQKTFDSKESMRKMEASLISKQQIEILLEKIKKLREYESLHGIEDLRETNHYDFHRFRIYFNRYKRKNESSDISFAEFIFCFERGLTLLKSIV